MEETEEERRQREGKKSSSLLDMLNPLNWFSGIGSIFDGIGSIFSFIIPALILAPILYFVAQNDTVQEWIGGFLDDEGKPGSGKAKVKGFMDNAQLMLAGALDKIGFSGLLDSQLDSMPIETIQKTLTDQGASAEALAILAPDKKTALENINFIRKEGDIANVTGDKTVFALLSKKPDMVASLMKTVKPTSAALTDAQKKFAGDMLTSVRSIIADGRIDSLIGPTAPNRTQYLALIQSLAPSLSIATLTKLVDAGYGADGKMNEEFRTTLGEMLTLDKPASAAAQKKLLLTVDSKIGAEIVRTVDTSQITDPKERKKAEAIKTLGPKGTQAAIELMKSGVDLEKEMEFFKGVSTASTENLVNHLLDSDDLRAKLKQGGNLDNLGVLIATQKPQTAAEKQQYDFITTRGQDGHYQNVAALVNLVDAMDRKGSDAENKQVLGQLMEVMRAPNEAARKKAISHINPNSFASFMKNHAPEFGTFLKQMNNGTLAPEQRQLIAGLRKTFGNLNEGIAEVLADPKGAKFILDKLAEPQTGKPPPADALIWTKLTWEGGKLYENGKHIIALTHALTPAATPKPPAAAPARH